MQADPNFPKPRKIGRLRFWDLDEIEEYERACAAEAVYIMHTKRGSPGAVAAAPRQNGVCFASKMWGGM